VSHVIPLKDGELHRLDPAGWPTGQFQLLRGKPEDLQRVLSP